MQYFEGEFIYHPEFKVGKVHRIVEGLNPVVEIDFRDRTRKQFTSFLLDRTVKKISPDGFWVIGYLDSSAAAKMLLEDPVDVIVHALEDFPGYTAKTEDLKEYLFPYIADWEPWWEKVQPKLKKDQRIDASKSQLREYALAGEFRSGAEEGYLSYRYAKQRSAEPEMLAEIARSALTSARSGQQLIREHYEELLDYLKNIIYLDRYAPSLRLGTLFRLKEDQLIPKDEAHEWLVRLLGKNIRLYQVETYTSKRIVDELIKSPIGEKEVDILSSGMCSTESLIHQLELWAFRKSDPDIISRFLVTALTENLPPTLDEKNYSTLKTRLSACVSLLNCLPRESLQWADIVIGFQTLVSSLASISKQDPIRFILPSVLSMAIALEKRKPADMPVGAPDLLDVLSAPSYPVSFILALIDGAKKGKPGDYGNRIERNFFDKAIFRQDDFLSVILGNAVGSPYEQAREILVLIRKYNSATLIERGGNQICTLALNAKDDELVEILPILNELRNHEINMSWKPKLESIREKGYLAMFTETVGIGYHDEALINAAKGLVDRRLGSIQLEGLGLVEKIKNLEEQVRSLQAIADEKETVLRELRGSAGGNTDEARFEERIRILKDLVGSIAEFERYLANQANPSKDVNAVIKRISNILTNYGVTSTEEIGTQVVFSPQKHRLVDSKNVALGESVKIVERGYIIRDHKDKLRLLKPALVQKIEESKGE